MSRYDLDGLFWQDPEPGGKRGSRPLRRPPVPDTGWVCPTEFPNLEAAGTLCIDLETCDTGLQAGKGPGEFRDDSYIAGVAVGTEDGHQWYFPIQHDGGGNLDRDKVLLWCKDQLCRSNQAKIGANLLYDLSYLYQAGVEVTGPFHDVQLAAPLLDEYAYSYSLGTLADKYSLEGKNDSELYSWLAKAFGGNATRNEQAGRIHNAPASLVGPYAESDVRLPFQIYNKQKAALEQEGLSGVYDLERRLISMLLHMRRKGVRVDLKRAEELHDTLMGRVKRDQTALDKLAGFHVDVGVNGDLIRLFKKLSLEYPLTGKGNPSFTGDFLKHHHHPATDLIVDVRKWRKFDGTFVQGYIFDSHINGRLHCSFHQLRSDTNGTVSGRFSSSNPNLQNIPARDPELGPLVRGLFIPEEGCSWEKKDYSQIEYRLMLHYATGDEAEAARQKFKDDPSTDYHAMVAKWSGLERKPAKNLNFGVIYGLGKDAMMQQYGWSAAQVDEFTGTYHEKVPYAKPLMDETMRVAGKRGYIKTLLGRRCRFNKWEPAKRCRKGKWTALPHHQAETKWPAEKLKRGFTYAALNRVLQGGAADIMKKAMADCWDAGVFDSIGAPHLTVHDELDISRNEDPATIEVMREIDNIMETCVDLKLPIKVDSEVGTNWGSVK